MVTQSVWKKVLTRGNVTSSDILGNTGLDDEGRMLMIQDGNGNLTFRYPIHKESVFGRVYMDDQWRVLGHGNTSYIVDSNYSGMIPNLPRAVAPLAFYTGCNDVDVEIMGAKISFAHSDTDFHQKNFQWRVVMSTANIADNASSNPVVQNVLNWQGTCASDRMRIFEDTDGATTVISEGKRLFLVGRVEDTTGTGYVSLRLDCQFKQNN